MNKKYIYGCLVFPIVPIFIYVVDALFFGAFLVEVSHNVCAALGLDKSYGDSNFYNYPFNRTIYFIAVFLSPFFVCYWFMCADYRRFKDEGPKSLMSVIGLVLITLLLIGLISFLPVTLGENPSRKQVSISNMHRNPIYFILFIYWFLYFGFMVFGMFGRYFYWYVRRNCVEH